MPIYEYTCQSCGHRFEHLTHGQHQAVCPECNGQSLRKHLSTFAVGAGGASTRATREVNGACGMCGDPRGPGSCSIN
jgi:putative FmdB family regulatory protein